MRYFELQLDGLIGPTHHYSGLAFGNLASTRNKDSIAHPREAALQGLRKMKLLMDLGIKQAVFPPIEVPNFETLRKLGFSGTEKQILEKAGKETPEFLAACTSASSMWTANLATVSPAADTPDKKIHFTPANLLSQFHRSLETKQASIFLKTFFHDRNFFTHHDPLPSTFPFCDEGAANHIQLCSDLGKPGIEILVYGQKASDTNKTSSKYPQRQTLEASQSIARLHGLIPERTLFVQQNPKAIDAGVFHNDVISVANRNVFLVHSEAFLHTEKFLHDLKQRFEALCGDTLIALQVPASKISLKEAVESYLFNSQLVTLPNSVGNTMALIAPIECQENTKIKKWIDNLLLQKHHPIRAVHYVDLRQSMKNGGGPACLRLRIPLSEKALASLSPSLILTPSLYETLCSWVEKHYRTELCVENLKDPDFFSEVRKAFQALSKILKRSGELL
jgi:succinylarginine dihydrolase